MGLFGDILNLGLKGVEMAREDSALQRKAKDASALGINSLTALGLQNGAETGNLQVQTSDPSINDMITAKQTSDVNDIEREKLANEKAKTSADIDRDIAELDIQKDELERKKIQDGLNHEEQQQLIALERRRVVLEENKQKFEQERTEREDRIKHNKEKVNALKSLFDNLKTIASKVNSSDSSYGIDGQIQASVQATLQNLDKASDWSNLTRSQRKRLERIMKSDGVASSLSQTITNGLNVSGQFGGYASFSDAQSITNQFITTPESLDGFQQKLAEIESVVQDGADIQVVYYNGSVYCYYTHGDTWKRITMVNGQLSGKNR